MQNPGDWNGRGLYKSCPKHPLWNTHWTTQWASIKYCIMILFSHHHYHYHHHHHHHHQTPMIFPQWSWRWRTKPNLAQNWSSTTPQDPPSGELGWGKVLKTFKESSESIKTTNQCVFISLHAILIEFQISMHKSLLDFVCFVLSKWN